MKFNRNHAGAEAAADIAAGGISLVVVVLMATVMGVLGLIHLAAVEWDVHAVHPVEAPLSDVLGSHASS